MENVLDHILIKYNKQSYIKPNWIKVARTTYKDYLYLNPEYLPQRERHFQNAMKDLYYYAHNFPLFTSFPDHGPDKPLTIDITKFPKNADGSYSSLYNDISISDRTNSNSILLSLAHELKHAEQTSQEEMMARYNSNLAYHQLGFLGEAQAYSFEIYIAMLIAKTNKYSREEFLSLVQNNIFEDYISNTFGIIDYHYKTSLENNTDLNAQQIQNDLILAGLPYLSKDTSYKRHYDECRAVNDNDADISHIPESFHLDKTFVEQQIIPELKKIPHEALEPKCRFHQLLSNKQEDLAKTFLSFYPSMAEDFASFSLSRLLGLFILHLPQINNQTELDAFELKLLNHFNFLLPYINTQSNTQNIKNLTQNAIHAGMPNLVQTILNSRNHDGSRILDNYNICRAFIFSYLFVPKSDLQLELSPSYTKLTEKHAEKIGAFFLDLKDDNNEPIISKDDINYIQNKLKDNLGILAKYKKSHPNDPRFTNKEALPHMLQKIASQAITLAFPKRLRTR